MALVFGSYSSSVRAVLPALASLQQRYADRVQFLFVYIREVGAGESTDPSDTAPRDPQTEMERIRIANSFANEVALSIPCVVDGMDDAAVKAYAAHPARLYLVGRDGRIVLVGRPASGGLDSGELALAISALNDDAK